MAFWWVSQNQTFKDESSGGYLWAPLEDKGGNTPHHWKTMKDVRPGDVIFSYFRQTIPAVSIASSSAYSFDRPFENNDSWMKPGLKIDSDYQFLDKPIYISSFVKGLLPLLPSKHSPLTSAGSGNQGYLFSLPKVAGEYLLGQIGKSDLEYNEIRALEEIKSNIKDDTVCKALVDSRIGQGQFRQDLLMYWDAKCCVTGLDVPSLLRASHIKPWRDSDNFERLDKYNGLLLSVQYDSAFDEGFITFEQDGKICLSGKLTPNQWELIGIKGNEKISNLNEGHLGYLEYHRNQIFKN